MAGPATLIASVRKTGLGQVDGNLSPHEAFLFLRGIKTLPLRMTAHCEGAAAVAHFLAGHPVVRAVHYPGLVSHPQHALARRFLQGGFGGMVAFELARNERSGLHPFSPEEQSRLAAAIVRKQLRQEFDERLESLSGLHPLS